MEEQDYQTVAIVAQTGRFPGADNVATFWNKIVGEEQGIQRLDTNTLNQRGVPQAQQSHPDFVNVDTHIANLEDFDAAFFGIHSREAKAMDPQHRMLLESTLNLLREAAISPDDFDGDIGLFAGVGFSQYLLHNIAQNPEQMEKLGENYTVIGNHLSYACTRVAHFFNFKGPVVALDTACSSSLLSVHMACKSLLNYECDMALAGGVQLNMPQFSGYRYEEGGFRSPDGECRTFDDDANGTVFGSGVGLVALRRLEDALADGDHIIALIRGSAINNDGSDKVGFTAPSVAGQRDVIEKALVFSGIDADSIGYVEAHGTGTPLGDPIELRALSEAYSHFTDRKQYCAIGSLKPAFSHMETASGVASLIKTALMLEHQILPATLNYQTPNQKVGFENTPFYVNTETRPWPDPDSPRRAAVSSFGIGGSNAHVILEAYDPVKFANDDEVELMQHSVPESQGEAAAPHLLLLSAKSQAALAGLAQSTRAHIEYYSDIDDAHDVKSESAKLTSLAYHLKHSTPAYAHRVAVAGHNVAELRQALSASSLMKQASNYDASIAHQVVFMFPGQGVQSVNMGRDLYHSETVFKQCIDECSNKLIDPLGVDLRSILFPEDEVQKQEADIKFQQTAYAQPALFVIEYALAQLWLSKGLQPSAFIGHSLGEYVAACLSGVFTLGSALDLICKRASLMQSAKAGAMTTISCNESELLTILDKVNQSPTQDAEATIPCEISARNAKNMFVVSGTEQGIQAFETQLTQQDITFARFNTSHAYHSSMMDEAASQFVEAVKAVPMQAPSVPFVSCVSGKWITDQEATSAQYWGKQIRASVNFATGLDTLSALENPVLIEVGPGQHLKVLLKKHLQASRTEDLKLAESTVIVSSMPNVRKSATNTPANVNEASAFYTALGQCWQRGLPLNWDAIVGEQPRPRLPLPAYVFQRERFWVLPAELEASFFEPPLPEPVFASNDAVQSTVTLSATTTASVETDALANWFQSIAWRSESLQQTLPVDPAVNQLADILNQPIVLVFDDGSETSQSGISQLKSLLVESSDDVIVIQQSKVFSRVDANTFTLKSGDAEQMKQLFAALTTQWQQKQSATLGTGVKDRTLYIANFWTLTLTSNTPIDVASDIALNDLMHLVQCCAELPLRSVRFCAVTEEANAVLGNEKVQPFASFVESACKVASHEFKDWCFAHIDADAQSHYLVNDVMAHVFASDAIFANSVEPAVVLRQGKRWQKQYQKEVLPAVNKGHKGTGSLSQNALKQGGTYLITGGFGGIGYALASHLASEYQATLILLGRTEIPARETWAQYQSDSDESPRLDKSASKIAGLINKIQSLEAKGATVFPVAADTADYDALQSAFSTASGQQTPISQCDGVFHGAGVAWSASLLFSNKRDVMNVIMGKVQGALNLNRYFSAAFATKLLTKPLDFTVYFSSIWSVLGGPGLLAYTAANRFLDALSASMQNVPFCKHTLAIDWSGWAQVGMAAELFKTEDEKSAAINPEQGIAALSRVMAQPSVVQHGVQLVIAPNAGEVVANREPQAIRPANAANHSHSGAQSGAQNQRASARGNAAQSGTAGQHANTASSGSVNAYAGSLENETETKLAAIWQETLGINDVDAEDNFFDLGGTSLLLSEVLRKVKQQVHDDVKIIDLFNHSTIRALSASLSSEKSKDDELDEIAQRAKKRRTQAKRRAGRGSEKDSQV